MCQGLAKLQAGKPWRGTMLSIYLTLSLVPKEDQLYQDKAFCWSFPFCPLNFLCSRQAGWVSEVGRTVAGLEQIVYFPLLVIMHDLLCLFLFFFFVNRDFPSMLSISAAHGCRCCLLSGVSVTEAAGIQRSPQVSWVSKATSEAEPCRARSQFAVVHMLQTTHPHAEGAGWPSRAARCFVGQINLCLLCDSPPLPVRCF